MHIISGPRSCFEVSECVLCVRCVGASTVLRYGAYVLIMYTISCMYGVYRVHALAQYYGTVLRYGV
jgi:hypothetical protein